jgi:hypothetical protein
MGNFIISVYGNMDVYKPARDNAFKEVLSPYKAIESSDVSIKFAYNQGIVEANKAAKTDMKVTSCFILCHNSIKPIKNWIQEFIRSGVYKNYSFICDSSALHFCVINILKVRKFGVYKRVGSSANLYEWLKQKSISEGHDYKIMDMETLVTNCKYIDIDEMITVKKPISKRKKRKTKSIIFSETKETEKSEEIEKLDNDIPIKARETEELEELEELDDDE